MSPRPPSGTARSINGTPRFEDSQPQTGLTFASVPQHFTQTRKVESTAYHPRGVLDGQSNMQNGINSFIPPPSSHGPAQYNGISEQYSSTANFQNYSNYIYPTTAVEGPGFAIPLAGNAIPFEGQTPSGISHLRNPSFSSSIYYGPFVQPQSISQAQYSQYFYPAQTVPYNFLSNPALNFQSEVHYPHVFAGHSTEVSALALKQLWTVPTFVHMRFQHTHSGSNNLSREVLASFPAANSSTGVVESRSTFLQNRKPKFTHSLPVRVQRPQGQFFHQFSYRSGLEQQHRRSKRPSFELKVRHFRLLLVPSNLTTSRMF